MGTRWRSPQLAGALLSVVVAVALESRFGIDRALNRDEAIYAYGGQQFVHGVPPYASIFDPKTPVATLLAGLAATVAHLLGRDDLYLIRSAFFACACLTVLAIYVLAARLWRSALAGLVAAVVFASFQGFARDALAGPEAKGPGLLLTIASMWLLVRRQWFLAAFAASLAFLVWQPFVFYAVAAVLVAVLSSPAGQRIRALGRAVAGAAIPLVLITIYFAATGALGKFVEAAIVFPAIGIQRGPETVVTRIARIATVVHNYYAFSGVLFWAGLIVLLVLVAFTVTQHFRRGAGRRAALLDPLVSVVLLTLVAEAGYAMSDFQSSPDLLPLLAYPALGLAGLATLAVDRVRTPGRRTIATAGTVVALTVLVAFSWSWFSTNPANTDGYPAQRADACAIERLLVPGTPLYSLGDPTPLVMTHRRNPDRFIYLGSGVDSWKVQHTSGGFLGWTSQIQASRPSVVVVKEWLTPLRFQMGTWLKSAGYRPAWIGSWYVFLTPAARARALTQGVVLGRLPSEVATGPAGNKVSCLNP